MPYRLVINTPVSPRGTLETLSQREVQQLSETTNGKTYQLFRQCALTILNTGVRSDSAKIILSAHKDSEVCIRQRDRGVCLGLINILASAFVDGEMIASTREMLFGALRDIVYIRSGLDGQHIDLGSPQSLTDYVFQLLRNARMLRPGVEPKTVVRWGDYSISSGGYECIRKVGHKFGLHSLGVCTGCGPGVMKGSMKGTTISHAKQHIVDGRHLGLTEPGIIATETPGSIVNRLVTLLDIEKRLETSARVGHRVIIFPGDAGTTEEFLYLLGIPIHPDNQDLPFPVILAGPRSVEAYLQQLYKFIRMTLGHATQRYYRIVTDDPAEVAKQMVQGLKEVKQLRRERSDASHFNWILKTDESFQRPFEPTHKNMASLQLSRNLPPHELVADLRRAFSGIVAGDVKDNDVHMIEQHGPYEIHGDPTVMLPPDRLLRAFIRQHQTKLPDDAIRVPCYRVVQTEAA